MKKTKVFKKLIILALLIASYCFSLPDAYAASYPNGNKEEIKVINTTEQALSFTFSGLTNEPVVHQVLQQLDDMGIKATFFVFEMEMRRYPHLIKEIKEHGHEIGLAINPRQEDDFVKIKSDITQAMAKLEKDFGIKTTFVKQPFGAVREEVLRSVVESGYYLIGQSINVIQTKHKDYTSAEQIMPEIFGVYRHSLARGEIVHFRMDYYTNDNVLAELIKAVKKQKIDNIAYATPFDNPQDNPENDSWYVIKPVGEVLFNEKYTWKYPLDPADMPEYVRKEGRFVEDFSVDDMEAASKYYIGTPTVNLENRMVGFVRKDVVRLDDVGKVTTDENVVFLTFDDWGTDVAINKLLYVMRKHNIKCTFFIITRTVEANKNLLRAIAVEGHEIGSHSHMHSPMAVLDSRGRKYVATQSPEEMLEDYTTANKILRSIVGDVVINGKPAFGRYFRPPTMAVSKKGFEALFNSGIEYIVGGSESSGDYESASVKDLVHKLQGGIFDMKGNVQKGAIVVMHMSDTSVYTAMTIDLFFTANEVKADDDPSKFKVGVFRDYLTDGYAQTVKKQTTRTF